MSIEIPIGNLEEFWFRLLYWPEYRSKKWKGENIQEEKIDGMRNSSRILVENAAVFVYYFI